MYRCKASFADTSNNSQTRAIDTIVVLNNESEEGDHDKSVTQQEGNHLVVGDEKVHGATTAAMGVASVTLFILQPSLVKQFALLFSCTQVIILYHISQTALSVVLLCI